MTTSYLPYESRQRQLRPNALQDWLPEEHLAELSALPRYRAGVGDHSREEIDDGRFAHVVSISVHS